MNEYIKKNRILIAIWIVMAVAFTLGVRGCCGMIESCSVKMNIEHREAYKAWMKIHPDKDLSFEEWESLRRQYLLPDQKNPNQY